MKNQLTIFMIFTAILQFISFTWIALLTDLPLIKTQLNAIKSYEMNLILLYLLKQIKQFISNKDQKSYPKYTKPVFDRCNFE